MSDDYRTDRRSLIAAGMAAGALALVPRGAAAQGGALAVRIDARDMRGAAPHVWSECAGSDRAAITMRESWRRDLDMWRSEAGLKRVRFHGILNDELGVWGNSILAAAQQREPNFQNVDRVYDGLVERGVSPFVELSFMPKHLASGERTFGFYNANVTPPTSVAAWGEFIRTFAIHLIQRYGLATVRTWPFEVWNEANLAFFWSGTQAQYFEMYKATAVALKSVDAGLTVGGPATSATAWIGEFLDYCGQNNAPVDFVSTHVYAGDNQRKLFGANESFAQADVIPEAMKRARATIDGSRFARLPLWLSEWSSDSPAMIAHVVANTAPVVHGMSQWVLSGTYEELGVADYLLKEGDMGWATIIQGIPLPSFNTYRLLNGLGTSRLGSDGPCLATRRADGGIAALMWNLADVKQPAGIPGMSRTRTVIGQRRQVTATFAGVRPGQRVRVRFVDQERGSPMPAWRRMGSPRYPTLAQIAALRAAATLPPPTAMRLDAHSSLTLDLPPEGVALVEIG